MEKQNKITKKQKKNKLSIVKRKHSAGSQEQSADNLSSNHVGSMHNRTAKQLPSQADSKETKHKVMQENVSQSPAVEQKRNRVKKRKRSREGQHGNALESTTSCKDDGKKDFNPPVTKKPKAEDDGLQLTRKQRRNRKKNYSKKNKYKHLALNKSGREENGAGKGPDKVPPGDISISRVTSQTGLSVVTDTLSTERKGSSQRNSVDVSRKKPVSAVQNQTLSKNSASAAEMSVTGTKRKRKGKNKSQKEQDLEIYSHPKIKIKTQEFSDSDDESDVSLESSDDENSDDDYEHGATNSNEPTHAASNIPQKEVPSKKTKPVSVVDKAREKLNAARFRFLNEQLYTSSGADALKMFQEDPDAFHVYHQGFQHQVAQWPVNPLDVIIKQVSKMSKSSVVADFGCGDARLAESLPHNTVHSFDLVSTKPCVTACDIAKVPLGDGCVDVAVFCLSLMGTNLTDYLLEANRVLHKGGLLKVAEVISRFYSVSRFAKNVEAVGFQLQKKVFLDKMFMLFTFKKVKDASRKKAPRIQLKACYYKRR